MKKLNIFLLLILISLFSCTKVDDNINDKIEIQWNGDKYTSFIGKDNKTIHSNNNNDGFYSFTFEDSKIDSNNYMITMFSKESGLHTLKILRNGEVIKEYSNEHSCTSIIINIKL